MRGRKKEFCLNCNDEIFIEKQDVFCDYSRLNTGFFAELSDKEKIDENTLCGECYDLEHG
jgi:hypothetical protein